MFVADQVAYDVIDIVVQMKNLVEMVDKMRNVKDTVIAIFDKGDGVPCRLKVEIDLTISDLDWRIRLCAKQLAETIDSVRAQV